jgi:hypothetical protein
LVEAAKGYGVQKEGAGGSRRELSVGKTLVFSWSTNRREHGESLGWFQNP